MYEAHELTEWFNTKFNIPPEIGVYQTRKHFSVLGERLYFSFWDGAKFRGGWEDKEEAIYRKDFVSFSHSELTEWRGLNYDPSLPRKLARSTDPETSKDAAKAIIKSGGHNSHMSRIYECLKSCGAMNTNQIAAKLKMRRSSVFRRLSDLRAEGKASRTGAKLDGQSVWNAI